MAEPGSAETQTQVSLKASLAEGKQWKGDPRITPQISALRDLVGVAVRRHKENMVNTDKDSRIPGVSRDPRDQRYESYYELPERGNALLLIRSLGSASQTIDADFAYDMSRRVSSAGFWVEVYEGNKGEMERVVNLQMHNNPLLIDYSDALDLSGYTLDQLDTIQRLVRSAKPINGDVFDIKRSGTIQR